MKYSVYHLFAYLLLAACSTKSAVDATVQSDSVHNNSIDDTTASTSEKFLTIKGKDIWVRDEPGTGKVIMKLNEGDRCKVLYPDQFEIIRGQADYWYQIEFDGQRGWVFGGQTDQSGKEPPTSIATSSEDFWKRLLEIEKEKCRLGNDPGISPGRDSSDDGPDCDCEFYVDGEVQAMTSESIQVPKKTFATHYSACNAAQFEYEIVPSRFVKIAFVNNTTMISAAGVSIYRYSIFSIQDGKGFKYYDKAKLNGWFYQTLEIGPDEFCLFTYQVGHSMGMGSEFWFNVYYINTSDMTVRRVIKQLGNFSKFNYREEISTDSIELKLKKDIAEFNLIEYKVKQEGEQYTPHDTLISTYSWDKRTRRFEKK